MTEEFEYIEAEVEEEVTDLIDLSVQGLCVTCLGTRFINDVVEEFGILYEGIVARNVGEQTVLHKCKCNLGINNDENLEEYGEEDSFLNAR